MELVVVLAKTYLEFRERVLEDFRIIGNGSVFFSNDDVSVAIFRSSEDSRHSIRYVWVKTRSEIKNLVGKDNFRIISKDGIEQAVDKSKRGRNAMLLAALILLAAAVLVELFDGKERFSERSGPYGIPAGRDR